MKKIHLLPTTSKPSRLKIGNDGKFVIALNQSAILSENDFFVNYNVYITDDSEIKKDEYYLGEDNNIYCLITSVNFNGKKIILTTDLDLIKDGVQSIPYEFLVFICKNPSWDEVEVEKIEGRYVDYNGNIHNPISYKIIIPKEELYNEIQQKSLNSNKHFVNNKSDSELNNLMVEFDNYDSEKHNKDVIMGLQKDPLLKEFDDKVNEKKSFLKQKQEILEEVAEKSAIENFEKGNSYYIVGFQNGAKWQQEQVNKSYSEEEVDVLVDMLQKCKEYFLLKTDSISDERADAIGQVLERFKKK